MTKPIATTGQPGVPRAIGGKPQKGKTIKVRAHTRTIKPKASKPAFAGETAGQRAYWENKLGPGASAKQIRSARAKQIYNHNPQAFGPNTNLTPLQLKSQVNAATQTQFGDQANQLHNTQSQIDPIYDAYARSIAAAQQATQQAAAQANSQITQNATNLENSNDTARQALLAQMQQAAAQQGGKVDNSLFANDLSAAASRKEAANTQANLASTLSQNAQTFLSGQGALGEGARAQRKADLANQIAQLGKQEGAFKTTQRANLIDNAVKQAIEYGTLGVSQQNANTTARNANTSAKLAVGNLSLKAQSQQEKTRHDKAGEKNARRGQNISASLRRDSQGLSRAQFIAKYGITPQQANKGVKPIRSLKGSGAGGLTPTQVRSYGKLRDKAISTLALDPKKPKANDKQGQINWANALTAKLSMPHDLAVAVVDKFVYGGVDKKTADHIYQRYGVHLKIGPKPGAGALAEPHF